jgi:hypothetical protein
MKICRGNRFGSWWGAAAVPDKLFEAKHRDTRDSVDTKVNGFKVSLGGFSGNRKEELRETWCTWASTAIITIFCSRVLTLLRYRYPEMNKCSVQCHECASSSKHGQLSTQS